MEYFQYLHYLDNVGNQYRKFNQLKSTDINTKKWVLSCKCKRCAKKQDGCSDSDDLINFPKNCLKRDQNCESPNVIESHELNCENIGEVNDLEDLNKNNELANPSQCQNSCENDFDTLQNNNDETCPRSLSRLAVNDVPKPQAQEGIAFKDQQDEHALSNSKRETQCRSWPFKLPKGFVCPMKNRTRMNVRNKRVDKLPADNSLLNEKENYSNDMQPTKLQGIILPMVKYLDKLKRQKLFNVYKPQSQDSLVNLKNTDVNTNHVFEIQNLHDQTVHCIEKINAPKKFGNLYGLQRLSTLSNLRRWPPNKTYPVKGDGPYESTDKSLDRIEKTEGVTNLLDLDSCQISKETCGMLFHTTNVTVNCWYNQNELGPSDRQLIPYENKSRNKKWHLRGRTRSAVCFISSKAFNLKKEECTTEHSQKDNQMALEVQKPQKTKDQEIIDLNKIVYFKFQGLQINDSDDPEATDKKKQLGYLGKLEGLNKLEELNKLETLDKFGSLGSLDKFGSLGSLDKFGSLASLDKSGNPETFDKFGNLESFEECENLETFDRFGNLETVDKCGNLEHFDKYENRGTVDKCGTRRNFNRNVNRETFDKYETRKNFDKCGNQECSGTFENQDKCRNQELLNRCTNARTVDKCGTTRTTIKNKKRRNLNKNANHKTLDKMRQHNRSPTQPDYDALRELVNPENDNMQKLDSLRKLEMLGNLDLLDKLKQLSLLQVM